MIRLRIRRCFGTCPWRRLDSFGGGRRRGWSLRLCRSLHGRLRWSFGRGFRRSLIHRYRVRRIRHHRGHGVGAARFFGGLGFVDSLYARRGKRRDLPKDCASAVGPGLIVCREVGVGRIKDRPDHHEREQHAFHTRTLRRRSPLGKTTEGPDPFLPPAVNGRGETDTDGFRLTFFERNRALNGARATPGHRG